MYFRKDLQVAKKRYSKSHLNDDHKVANQLFNCLSNFSSLSIFRNQSISRHPPECLIYDFDTV